MKPTRQLHEVGQSLWLDSISRELLATGRLRRYIDELSVTGLTSNPTIFDHAIEHSSDYDELLPTDGGDADEILAEFDRAGVDIAALAAKLQSDGEQSFDQSWDSLLVALERNIGRLGGNR
jgi:transaldolase